MSRLRKLGALENLYCNLHQLGANRVVQVAQITGEVEVAGLEQALRLVVQRHPMLRVRLVERDNALGFAIQDPLVLNFQVLERHDAQQWQAIATQEIHTPFDPQHSMWRLIWLRSTQTSELIFTYHHAIADGISYTIFIRDLLTYTSQLIQGQSPQVESLSILPAIDQLCPAKLGLRYLLKKALHQLFPPQSLLETAVPPEQRTTRFVPRSLDQETTIRLRSRCRQEQTTIQGALCAAMLLSTRAIAFPQQKVRFLSDSSIDLRSFCRDAFPALPIGSMSAIAEVMHTLSQETHFWDLARTCKREINRAIQRQEPQKWLALFDFLKPSPTFLSQQAQTNLGRSSTIAVSNLGAFPFPTGYDSLTLNAIYFTTGIHWIGAGLWLGVATCQDQMTLSFAYASPVVSDATADLIIQQVLRSLKEA
jgi:NRPS condensation-like uncharacterized protein